MSDPEAKDAEAARQCANCAAWVPLANLEVHGAFCSRNLSSPVAAEASASAAVGQGRITGGAAAGVAATDGTGVDAAAGLREDDGEAVQCEFCGLEFGCAAIVTHAEYCGSRTERCDDCRRYIALRDLPAHVVSGCGLPSRDSAADYPALGSTRQSLVPRGQVRPRPAGLVGRFHSRQGLTVAACVSRQGGLEDEGSACPYCAEECGDWSRVLLHLEATACDEAAELSELSGSWQARVQQKKELAKRKAREARRLALTQCGGGHLLRVNHHPASANARCDRCAAVSTRYRCTEVR